MEIDFSLLQGSLVRLEALNESHIEMLRPLARDGRIWEYTKTLLINDTYNEQFDKYIALALNPNPFLPQQSFVMRDVQTDEVMGMTRFYKIEPDHKRLDIGYTWYVPNYWGKAHNKECKLLLLQYAFETLGFRRVEFEVAHKNIRSQKAVEKIGGIREGLLRKHALQPDGDVRHTVVFSIVDDEWPGAKQQLRLLISAAGGDEKNQARVV